MDSFEKQGEKKEVDSKFRQEIYSKAVRAGKRTYFFDVKSTRKNEYYLTITESKKKYDQDGSFHFEKHKIFLYKEDFDKFTDGLNEVVNFIVSNEPENDPEQIIKEQEQEEVPDKSEKVVDKDYTNVEFEDLSN